MSADGLLLLMLLVDGRAVFVSGARVFAELLMRTRRPHPDEWIHYQAFYRILPVIYIRCSAGLPWSKS